jgi:hypothetical protein
VLADMGREIEFDSKIAVPLVSFASVVAFAAFAA